MTPYFSDWVFALRRRSSLIRSDRFKIYDWAREQNLEREKSVLISLLVSVKTDKIQANEQRLVECTCCYLKWDAIRNMSFWFRRFGDFWHRQQSWWLNFVSRDLPFWEMATLRELQCSLALKAEELKSKDETISHLHNELELKNQMIENMQIELDKFKQILKPMTQQLTQNLTIQALVLDDKSPSPGRDGNTISCPAKVTSGSKFGGLGSMLSGSGSSGPFSRIKRFAISAEPTKYSASANPAKDMIIKKIEKNAE